MITVRQERSHLRDTQSRSCLALPRSRPRGCYRRWLSATRAAGIRSQD